MLLLNNSATYMILLILLYSAGFCIFFFIIADIFKGGTFNTLICSFNSRTGIAGTEG